MDVTLSLLLLAAISVANGYLSKVWSLSPRELTGFRSYRDITVLHFRVPEQTFTASFNFTVSEKLISSQLFSGCDPRRISLYLKYGSLPVINPDGAKFPDNFSISNRVPIYNAEFQSNNVPAILNVTGPYPGDWFAIAFISYTDPNKDQILQDGLSPNCVAVIESSMSVVITQDAKVIIPGSQISGQIDANTQSENFKFYVPSGTWMVQLNLTSDHCDIAPCLVFSYAPIAIPDPEFTNGNCESRITCEKDFIPVVDNWYYVTVSATRNVSDNPILFSLNVSFLAYNSTEKWNLINTTTPPHPNIQKFGHDLLVDGVEMFWNLVPLARQSFSGFFTFNYRSEHAEENKSFFSVNVSADELTLMQFEVNHVSDIGGTLTFEMKLEEDSNLKNVTENLYNVSVVACLSYQARAVPLYPQDECINYTGGFSKTKIQVNSSSEVNRIGSIHVPFPEPGLWFITLKSFCFNNDSLPTNCTPDQGKTNVSLIIESNMCTVDFCGRFGDCYNYMSGGFIFSTCVCRHGYTGWGCSDDSKVTSMTDLLIATLLLTISNMFFIPAIVLSLRYKYYTEAFVYACTMFFSTFYHACDAGEDIYSFCLMRLNVLQFCDFYSAILSLWVTLIAMSDVRSGLKSIAHMAGAIGIALGTEYDRTSLWVLAVPALVGVAVMTQSWVWRCKYQRPCYPSHKYWKFCFPPGVILVTVGLVCYSFLETKQNYKYVHSAWHIIMALAIIFLLPSKKQLRSGQGDLEEPVSLPSLTCTSSSWRDNKFLKFLCWGKR